MRNPLPFHFKNSSLQISFDLSLARGLDYYTGIIYEAIVEASAPPGFKAANAFAAPSETTSSVPEAAPAAVSKKRSNELAAGLVTVKEQKSEFVDGKKVKIESTDKGTQVKRAELVAWLKGTATDAGDNSVRLGVGRSILNCRLKCVFE